MEAFKYLKTSKKHPFSLFAIETLQATAGLEGETKGEKTEKTEGTKPVEVGKPLLPLFEGASALNSEDGLKGR